MIEIIKTPEQLRGIAKSLKEEQIRSEVSIESVLEKLEGWAKTLDDPSFSDVPGLAFLRMWLRRSTLDSILDRELGSSFAKGKWVKQGMANFRAFPLGLVGHWPAGNVEIQPFISMACGLLGGNAALVRVPNGLVDICEPIFEKLYEADTEGQICPLIKLVSFDHRQKQLQNAMATELDGAMIWGGEASVLANRSLPFPHWCRIALFGPRISIAFIDKGVVENKSERRKVCRRLARDMWQFDQMACSSPQVLFVEDGASMEELIEGLKEAFIEENLVHPRPDIDPSLTADITVARAEWLISDPRHKAAYPNGPNWTILVGDSVELPDPVQGKTLFVQQIPDLMEAALRLDGNVQTLGLALADAEKERRLVDVACRQGVDRAVKLGRMHVFDSPWDGRELVKPMVRMVRYLPSS